MNQISSVTANIIMFNEPSLSTNSNSETCASQRSVILEAPKVADPMTRDESGLCAGWPSNHEPLWGSQLPAADYRLKEAPDGAGTIVDFLKDLSESLEEGWLRYRAWTWSSHLTDPVYSIASCERSSSAGSSPGSDAFLHGNELKTQTDGSSSVNHDCQSISEIHELFESCAETITTLLDLSRPWLMGNDFKMAKSLWTTISVPNTSHTRQASQLIIGSTTHNPDLAATGY